MSFFILESEHAYPSKQEQEFSLFWFKLPHPSYCQIFLGTPYIWTGWTLWSKCNVSYGNGTRYRYRKCVPGSCGQECAGYESVSELCYIPGGTYRTFYLVLREREREKERGVCIFYSNISFQPLFSKHGHLGSLEIVTLPVEGDSVWSSGPLSKWMLQPTVQSFLL